MPQPLSVLTLIAHQLSKGILRNTQGCNFGNSLELRKQTIKVSEIKIGPVIGRQTNLKEKKRNPIEGERNNGLKDILIMSLSPKSDAETEDPAACPDLLFTRLLCAPGARHVPKLLMVSLAL